MTQGTILAWLLSLGISTLAVFVLSLVTALPRRKGFNLLTDFPQELFERNLSAGKALFFLYCGLDAFASAFLLFTNVLHPQLFEFSIVYVVLAVLKNVALVALTIVPAYEFKPHFFAFVSFAAMHVLGLALSSILFANLTGVNQGLALTFCILTGALGLASLGFMVNPKLSQWAKLDSKVEEDGSIVTSRPKPFVLAFTQWCLIFGSLLGTILSLVGFALLGLAAL